MKPNNKVIIFDMDGVLFDTVDFIFENFFKVIYPDITREIYKESSCENVFEAMSKINLPKKLETEEEKTIRFQKYSEEKSKMPLFAGARELLEKLHKRGFILIINTSAVNRNCLPIFEYSKTGHLFDLIASAELSKSKVEKFKIIQERYGVEKKDMLFVTDTVGDIKEAEEAGIPTVAVTWGVHDRTYFERQKFSNLMTIVDTIKELEEFILKF
jgi:phosphoglycolate phosphatase